MLADIQPEIKKYLIHVFWVLSLVLLLEQTPHPPLFILDLLKYVFFFIFLASWGNLTLISKINQDRGEAGRRLFVLKEQNKGLCRFLVLFLFCFFIKRSSRNQTEKQNCSCTWIFTEYIICEQIVWTYLPFY